MPKFPDCQWSHYFVLQYSDSVIGKWSQCLTSFCTDFGSFFGLKRGDGTPLKKRFGDFDFKINSQYFKNFFSELRFGKKGSDEIEIRLHGRMSQFIIFCRFFFFE